jgi:hypothetical protein
MKDRTVSYGSIFEPITNILVQSNYNVINHTEFFTVRPKELYADNIVAVWHIKLKG